MKSQFFLTPAAVTKILLRVVLCLVVISFLTQMTLYFFPDYPVINYLAKAFNVDYERNIPTAYSALALLFSSILLDAIAHAKNLDSSRYKHHWKVLSFIFLYLSLDEATQLHEQLVGPMRSLLNATGFLYFTWIVPFGFLVAIFLLSYTKFLFHLPASTKKMFVAASILYIGGALGMEMLGGYLASTVGMQTMPYLITATVEEFLEMLGIVVFIHALISYIKTYLGGLTWEISFGGKPQRLSDRTSMDIAVISEPANRK